MAKDDYPDTLGANGQERLRGFIERIENLDNEAAEIRDDRKELLAQAKGEGFDVKIINRVLRYRKKDRAKAQEEDALFDLYFHAVESRPAEHKSIGKGK